MQIFYEKIILVSALNRLNLASPLQRVINNKIYNEK